jgi:hypothetical protein
MKIKGIEFDVEVNWDSSEGRIESMAVFLEGSDVELSDVLDQKVLDAIEDKYYRDNPLGNMPEDDPREDR